MRQRFKDRLEYIGDLIKSLIGKIFSSRLSIVGTVFVLLFVVIFSRLFYLQIVMSDYYTDNFVQKSEKTITTNGPRGNIYDSDGNLLAYNVISYSVTLADEVPSSDKRAEILNGLIYKAIQLIEENGDEIIDDFNLEVNGKNQFVFKEQPVTRMITFLINIYGLKSAEIYEKGYDKKTAAELMSDICDKFGIDRLTYTNEEIIKIATIRYALSLNAYQKYVSTVISVNVTDKTKAAILEYTDELPGIDITENYKRVYVDPIYFSHIVGYTGQISESELEEYNLENATGIEYKAGDIVGKAGVEQIMDAYLQGVRGTEKVFVDATGNVLESIEKSKSGSGYDIHLTIDHDLQIAAYTILEQKLAACLLEKLVDYYVPKQEKSNYVPIPAIDVYFQLLTNVCDFSKFNREDASDREQMAYGIFQKAKDEIVQGIEEELLDPEAQPVSYLGYEYNEYMFFVYDMLGTEGILDKSAIDRNDAIYKRWANEQISLREFLQHAIAENWINISALDSSKKYSNSDEIYDAIVANTLSLLADSRDFDEKIYYFLVYNVEISPFDICMMLYDQGCLEYDDGYAMLDSRRWSPFDYIKYQIEHLVITPAMLALDPCSGSLCIVDSDTGKVKALVSYPSYDNNKLSGKIDSEYWYKLNIDDSSPMFNRATMSLTAPGSTFKLCTSVAVLAEDVFTVDTAINDEGPFTLVTPSPKCYIYPASHGVVNVSHALEHSCNYYYFQAGYDLGIDEKGEYSSTQALDIIENYAKQLGLGIKSGVEVPEVAPRVSTTDSVRTAIGQGTNGFAAVHMARYVNTIANSGVNYQLSLVDRITDRNDNTVWKIEPVITNKVELEQEEWDAIHYGMRLVIVGDGTAKDFFTSFEGTLAGKTGTAEENIYRSNHTAFVGYSPYNEPEIAFSCMIRNSDSTSYPGAVLCDVLKYYWGEMTLEEVFNQKVENTIAGWHGE